MYSGYIFSFILYHDTNYYLFKTLTVYELTNINLFILFVFSIEIQSCQSEFIAILKKKKNTK